MKPNWATEAEAEPWDKVVLSNAQLNEIKIPHMISWMLEETSADQRYTYYQLAGYSAYCFAFENPATAFAFKIRWA